MTATRLGKTKPKKARSSKTRSPRTKSKSKSPKTQSTKRSAPRSGGDRFAGRRMAEERRQGLRRLRWVLGLTAVSTLAIGVIGFLNSSWFDVDEIIVTGNVRSEPQLIVDASQVEIGQALLEVDLDGAVSSVELVPWVGTATVTRAWTGAIEIAVTERGPSAVLDAGSRFALVDDHGRQLEIVDSRPEGFMPIIGIEGSGIAGEAAPDAALTVISLLDALPVEVEERIGAVVLEDEHLFLELTDGGRANFGDGSDLGPKLQSLETMLSSVDLACVTTIDLRVPAAPTLTRSQSATESGIDASKASPEIVTESNDGEEPDYAATDC